MKITEILEADMLDIIFENRNKDYGAYALRKYYHERLYKALGIIFLFISILSVYSLSHKANIVLKAPDIFTVQDHVLRPVPKEKVVSQATKPKQPIIQKVLNSAIFTSLIKLVDSADQSTRPIKDLTNTAISNIDHSGPGNIKQMLQAPGIPGEIDSVKRPAIFIDKNKPLADVEIMPAYPGGETALIKFIQTNLQNPQDLEEGQVVSVKIKFVVGYDGMLKGFETIEDGGKAFNNEVIRVLKKMPPWIPGKTAGENVSVYYTIPVKFVSQE